MNTSRAAVVGVVLFLTVMSSSARGATPPRPIPVTMLVPGFSVRELPVDLTNLNSLEYTPDGKLWALGYDGRIHILTDADGDGVEETARTWWQPKDAKAFRGPVGMKVTPQGVYVASKGKISLIKDTDNDGTADTEEIISTGWKEAYVAVDATGMALDRDGNVYFGLGCADFSNAYQLDKEKKPHYDIHSTQGTIQKLSADHQTRQTVATGVRFAIGIAINRLGDVFWTDQEGDTWTHGNHRDELNVLLPGVRHYGFPERHPEYLPNTDDEPPVVSFGPQHQSTCGLKFNEPKPGWKTFGPKLWENDALVAGESRGKIWRVPLAKVREGYVGRSPIAIASTGMLTIDLAVSPAGAMVICCHSGPPDWGTGPTGKGRLFKISYVNPEAPQPVIAWPAAKDEIRVAFDRAVDRSVTQRLSGLSVACGEYVRSADRLEVMRPPYAVVKAQMQTTHRDLKIASASLSDDGRTLSIKLAEPMPWRSWYALAIPGVKAPGSAGLGETVDVDFPMTGAEAEMNVHNAGAPRSGIQKDWLPYLSPETSLELAHGSSAIDALARQLEPKSLQADLALSCKLDLPGTHARVHVSAERPFTAQAMPVGGVMTVKGNQKTGPQYEGDVFFATDSGPVPFSIDLDVTGGGATGLMLTYTTDQSRTPRPIPPDRILPRWAPTERQPVVTTASPSPLTQGGNWAAGKALFFGEAKCSTCHTVHGEGGAVGPNLSYLSNVNPESVLQDIVEPSARINPDHVNYIVETKSGDTVSGLVRQEADKVIVYEAADKTTTLARDDVKELRPSKISLMPEGYKDLGPEKLRDVLTFLTSEAPKGK
jgi:putative heme-binding domain-containing protein